MGHDHTDRLSVRAKPLSEAAAGSNWAARMRDEAGQEPSTKLPAPTNTDKSGTVIGSDGQTYVLSSFPPTTPNPGLKR